METDAPDIPPQWLYRTAEARAAGATMRNEPAELPRIGAGAGRAARRSTPRRWPRRPPRNASRRCRASPAWLARTRRAHERARPRSRLELPEVTISESAAFATCTSTRPGSRARCGIDAAARDRARVRAADDGLDAVPRPRPSWPRGARGAARPRRRRRSPASATSGCACAPPRSSSTRRVIDACRLWFRLPRRRAAPRRCSTMDAGALRRRRRARAARRRAVRSISTTTRRPAPVLDSDAFYRDCRALLGRRRGDDGQPVRPRRQLRAQRRAHRRGLRRRRRSMRLQADARRQHHRRGDEACHGAGPQTCLPGVPKTSKLAGSCRPASGCACCTRAGRAPASLPELPPA